MKNSRRRALLGASLAAAFAASAFAGSAQANTTIPGLNGKILFTSTRDFPTQPITFAPARDVTCFAEQSCSDELYWMNPDGSSQTRLTNNQSDDNEGAWLPADGSRIAFESNRNADGSDCTIDCNYNIWSMVGDGSSPVQLTSDPGDETHATYSPDGSQIAFGGQAQPPSGAPRLFLPSGSEIFVMPASGEGTTGATPLLPSGQVGDISPTQAAFDTFPTWSPDGTKIAFTRLTITAPQQPVSPDKGILPGTTFDIRTYVAPAAGGGPATPVETTFAPCAIPVSASADLSSATSSIEQALASGSAGALSSATQNRLLFPGCTFDGFPAWSPDGSRIAVTRIDTGTLAPPVSGDRLLALNGDPGDIVVIPVANPAAEVNLSNVGEPADCESNGNCSEDSYPAWSPDGTKIAFYSDRLADGTSLASGSSSNCFDQTTGEPNGQCDYEIWTMNADGTGLAQLTNNNIDDTNPDWQRIPPPPPPPAAPTPPPAAPAVAPKVGVAGVRRACVSKSFHVRFRITTTASSVKRVVVKLDGRRIKSTSKSSFTLRINARKLRAGRHRLTVTATASNGKVTTRRKSFSVCKAAKPHRKAAPRFTG